MMKTQKLACPNCGKKETWQSKNPNRPFCSERCKLIDLGQWADEKYKVPGESIDVQELLDEGQHHR